MVGVEEFFALISFIVPGYIVILLISFVSEYIREKDVYERIMHYLLFSFICYFVSLILLVLFKIFLSLTFFNFDIIHNFNILDLISDNLIYLTALSIISSPFIGYFLGVYVFNKNPARFFSRYNNRIWSESVYSDVDKKYSKSGYYALIYLDNDTIIRGVVKYLDKDEDNRDYCFGLINAQIIYSDKNEPDDFKGDILIINTKNAKYVEIKGPKNLIF